MRPAQVTNGRYRGGYGSPVIAGGRVLQFIDDLGAKKEIVVCLAAQNGYTLWTKRISSPEKLMHAASGSPCVADSRVYIMGGRDAYCLDVKTGDLLWKHDALADSKPEPDGYVQETQFSFIIAEGIAAVVSCGRFLGLEVSTGKTVWTGPDPGGIRGTTPPRLCGSVMAKHISSIVAAPA
jgi:outer membrane protein assembly factor BamB